MHDPVPTARLLAALALTPILAAASPAQGLSVSRLDNDQALEALLPAPDAWAQARAGNRSLTGTHELALGSGASVLAQGQRAWTSGAAIALRVTYDGFGWLTLDVGGQTLSAKVGGQFTSLALRASSRSPGAGLQLWSLSLNQSWLGPGMSAHSQAGEEDLDILFVQGASLAHGFVLRGTLRPTWWNPAPSGDELALEVRFGREEQVAQRFCAAGPNSTGRPCELAWSGTTSISANDLTLSASGGVPASACLFLASRGSQALPMGNGLLCLAAPIERLDPILGFDALGCASLPLDLTAGPLGGGALALAPGELRTFQLWYRDPGGAPEVFDFSDGLALTFVP